MNTVHNTNRIDITSLVAIVRQNNVQGRFPVEAKFLADIDRLNGIGTQKQAKWLADIVAAAGLGVMPEPKKVIEPKAQQVIERRLGSGVFRRGFALDKGIMIKRVKRDHCSHNKREAKIYAASQGMVRAALCPAWLDTNGDLVMPMVADYVNTGVFQPTGNGDYKHSNNDRKITKENYDALMLACRTLDLDDCSPNERTQGGWIGEWFCFTDYAL